MWKTCILISPYLLLLRLHLRERIPRENKISPCVEFTQKEAEKIEENIEGEEEQNRGRYGKLCVLYTKSKYNAAWASRGCEPQICWKKKKIERERGGTTEESPWPDQRRQSQENEKKSVLTFFENTHSLQSSTLVIYLLSFWRPPLASIISISISSSSISINHHHMPSGCSLCDC